MTALTRRVLTACSFRTLRGPALFVAPELVRGVHIDRIAGRGDIVEEVAMGGQMAAGAAVGIGRREGRPPLIEVHDEGVTGSGGVAARVMRPGRQAASTARTA